MKKELFAFFIFLNTLFGFSQNMQKKRVLIGQVKGYDFFEIKCEKEVDSEFYIFTYKDLNYQNSKNYKSFRIKNIDNSFEKLHQIIVKGIVDKPKEDITIYISDKDHITIHFVRVFGAGNVYFTSNVNGLEGISAWLTKRKIRILFGK